MSPFVTGSRMSVYIDFFVSVQFELYLKELNDVCFFILQQIKEMLTIRVGLLNVFIPHLVTSIPLSPLTSVLMV